MIYKVKIHQYQSERWQTQGQMIYKAKYNVKSEKYKIKFKVKFYLLFNQKYCTIHFSINKGSFAPFQMINIPDTTNN
jgi:hypothetical protein